MSHSAPARTLRFALGGFALCLLLVIAVRPAAAQADPYGPQTIFTPDNGFSAALFACQGPSCLTDIMRDQGASELAIAFTNATDGGYMAAFDEHGLVDLATVWYPTRANDNVQFMMVNGVPPLVGAEEAWNVNLAGHPAYAGLLAAYPQLTLWAGDNHFAGVEPRALGGQRFLFNYVLVDGCHACDQLGWARVAFDFDAVGYFREMTLLEPPSAEAVATTIAATSAALDAAVAQATTAAASAPTATLPPTAAPRQVAYHDEAGAIWIVDDRGASARPIAGGGRCCVSWSADGGQLFYLGGLADADDHAPRPILVYDMATGQERVLGATSLAVASLGYAQSHALPFTHNRPPTDAALIDNSACLAEIDPQSGSVVELGCLDGLFLDRPVETSDATGLMMGFSGFEITGIFFYHYRNGFMPNPIGCCGAPSFFPDLTYATWASQYYLSNLWTYEPASTGIFRWQFGSDAPEPLYVSSRPLGAPDVSPEGDQVVFSEEGSITVLDLATNGTRVIGSGHEPRWRPGAPAARPAVDQTPVPLTPTPRPTLPALAAFAVVPPEVRGVAGQSIVIPVRIMNSGGQVLSGATISASVGDQPPATAAVPDLAAGESAEVALSVVVAEPGQTTARVELTRGGPPDFRLVTLIVERGGAAGAEAGDEAAVAPGEAAVEESRWPVIVLGLVALLAAAGALGLFLLWLRRRPAAATPVAPATPAGPTAPAAAADDCPECGQPRIRATRFCTHCGYRFPGDPAVE